jgi:hypothetical protein
MEPFIINAAYKLAEGICLLLTDKSDYYPERLSENMLSLFQKFKASYDSKDITQLSRIISDSYSGSLYGAKTKHSFVQLLKSTLDAFPRFLYLNLTINIYQITDNSDKLFGAIMDFESIVKVAFVPIGSIDSGQVYVEVRPDGAYGMWRITRIDTM